MRMVLYFIVFSLTSEQKMLCFCKVSLSCWTKFNARAGPMVFWNLVYWCIWKLILYIGYSRFSKSFYYRTNRDNISNVHSFYSGANKRLLQEWSCIGWGAGATESGREGRRAHETCTYRRGYQLKRKNKIKYRI